MTIKKYASCLALIFWLSIPLRALEFHVAVTGNDAGSGSASSPFATISRARDTVRTLKSAGGIPVGGVTIWLHGGFYELSSPLVLDARDAGSADKPIVYAAWGGERVHVTGGRRLDGSSFVPVDSNSPAWARLDVVARGQVYVTNLYTHGLSNLGVLKPRGFGLENSSALELFSQARPMTLARWPNKGASMAVTTAAPTLTRIHYAGARPERWTRAEEVWLDGFWASTWAEFHVRAARIDVAAKAIDFTAAPAQFGVEAGRPYYAYNLLEELDEPGEYYVDRSSGLLYLWPREALATTTLQVSMVEEALLQLKATQHLTLRNLIIEVSRGPLVLIDGGSNNRIENSILRNAGQYGVRISGASNGLDQCEILDCGDDGVIISGGDRASLTPANNFVTNSKIERVGRIGLTYHPGINFIGGCGNIASHNLLGDMPHSAILLAGNLHRIEHNEIRRVCRMTSDAGAIYAGRDWSYRGNSIRYNFVHHLDSSQAGNGVHGVYLDDTMAGALVFGNVFYKIAGAGIFCGGGRDNDMRNNLIVACEMGHYNGDYARDQINNIPGSSWNVLERLSADGIQYQREPWASRFPSLASVPNSWTGIQQGGWRSPQNCIFSDNAGWSNGNWMMETNFSGTGIFGAYATIANNSPAHSPLFHDDASLDRAKRAVTLQASTVNFTPIAFAAIGPASSGVSPRVVPATPLLISNDVSFSTVELRWSNAGNLPGSRETGFIVERRAVAQETWSTILALAANSDAASITSLAASTSYEFRVKAYNAAGTVYSNVLKLTTDAAPMTAGPSTRTEAESSYTVLSDSGGFGSVGVSNALLDSGQSIRLFDVGDAIRIGFHVKESSQYRIGLRVRSGDASIPVGSNYWPAGYRFKLDGRDFELKGDPATVSQVDLSYGPTYWGTMHSSAVILGAGAHTFEVAAAMSWGVVDYLEIAPLSGTAIKTFADWQRAKFTSSQLNDTTISGPAAQPTKDGIANLLKYALGLDPWTAVSSSIAHVSTVAGKSRIEYAKPPGLTDIGYAVEVSDNQSDWSAIPQISLGQSDGLEVMQGTDTAAVSRRYIRLKVSNGATAEHSEAFTVNLPSGTLPPGPVAGRIEIENSFVVINDLGDNGVVVSHDGEWDSGRSVSLFDVGDAVRIPFTITAAGVHRLAIRVRAGDAGNTMAYWPGGYRFKVDGVEMNLVGDAASLSAMDSSYGSAYWGTMVGETVALSPGAHTLEVIAVRAWAVVDYIEFLPSGRTRVEAEAQLTVVNDTGSKGVVAVHNAVGDSGGSVSLFDEGDAVRVAFTMQSTGSVRLGVRVRSGDASSSTAFWPSGYSFKLDGRTIALAGDASTVSQMDASYGVTYWGTMFGEVGAISAGTHFLEIVSGRAWAVVDYLEIVPLTGAAKKTVRIEAEAPLGIVADVGSNGAVEVHNANLDSGGCVSLFDVGDAVRVTFPVVAAGALEIAIRLRSGDAVSSTAFWPGGYHFKLDGQPFSPAGDPSTTSSMDLTFGPTYWGTISGITPVLPAGMHTLEITAARSWAAIDFVEITSSPSMN